MSGDEQSRNKRVRTRLPLTWKASFKSTIFNISNGGLYFKCNIPPSVGEHLELNFTLPGGTEPITAGGIVRWTSNNSNLGESENVYGVGLEFEALSDKARTALEAYIAQGLEEQRHSKRLQVRIVVDYMFAGSNYRTIANDISRFGMFLVTDEPLQLDDVLHMRFRLPMLDAMLKVRAMVRWRHDAIPQTLSSVITPGMGVEFMDVTEEDLLLIDQFLAAGFSEKKA